jgi:phage terminase large subunit GpA-like protein
MISREVLEQRLRRLWAPPPVLTMSEWANRYRHLSPEASAKPGPWTTLAFQREPMDAVSDPRVRRVVIKSATQMLKSVTIENAIGYFAHQDPGPMLLLQPGDTDAKDFSKERIAPMIRDTPVLRGLFSESKTRSSDSTITEKLFPGGLLAIAGTGSPRNVARRAIRFLFADEIDKYKPTLEGNPLALARKRLATFRHRAKEVLTCSPTFLASEIDRAYEQSDQRECFVPCPHCGAFQSLMRKFESQVRWDNSKSLSFEQRAATALYHCEFCDAGWDDAERWAAVEKCEWRAQAVFAGVAGFWISELYSPWKMLRDIVLDFLSKKDNPGDLQTFVNTSLAENWTGKGEAPADELLYERARRERYERGNVPWNGLFLTAGVDVQKTYLQAEIVAWGRGKESWSIDYRVLDGNPQQPEVWRRLAVLLNETFPHESGLQLPIAKMAVDSGYATNDVYAWVRAQGGRAIAVDGRPRGNIPVAHPKPVDVTIGGKRIANGLKIWPVATGLLKSELYGWLMLSMPTDEELDRGEIYPPGFCHFPPYDAEFFQQLTAEQLVTRYEKGFPKPEWQKTRPRNEALDCRIYARAAAYVVGLDRFKDEQWRELEGRAEAMKARIANTPAPPRQAQPQRPIRARFEI